jgi:NADP-dependent 3-hydroxy acid dehydrogenase YdfG
LIFHTHTHTHLLLLLLLLSLPQCDVVLAARRPADLQASQAEVTAAQQPSAKSLCVVTDVTKRADVLALHAEAEAKVGLVDIWVNCAGVM